MLLLGRADQRWSARPFFVPVPASELGCHAVNARPTDVAGEQELKSSRFRSVHLSTSLLSQRIAYGKARLQLSVGVMQLWIRSLDW